LAQLRRRQNISNALRTALQHRQFSLVYQPIVDLETGRMVKVEALIRWDCPRLPGVGPAEFIPIAEDLGLIEDIDDWVFEQAALAARDINLALATPVQVSINKSARQLASVESAQRCLQCLAALGMPAAWVCVEITESLLLDGRPSVQTALSALREAGVQLSLDDFGTGYSAMSYLLRFELDYLKIDQSFTRNAGSDRGRAIVEAMVGMAHRLGLRVIAEGVEEAAVLAILREIGCDLVQGYYYAKPMPCDELIQWARH
jgi:EAL domain-containing protein (putative c-di-GMP-specific phosphodiesterase class I)